MTFSELTENNGFAEILNKRCPACMREIGEEDVCPHCFRSRSVRQAPPFLPQGCSVADRYLIGACLSSGGDGNTYAAFDMQTETRVFLREFFPDAVCTREKNEAEQLTVLSGCESVFEESRADFIRLWNRLIGLRGLSSLISVRELMTDLGTVFALIEDRGFVTLDTYLSTKPGECISWDELRPGLLPLLSTAEALHSTGIIHAGISPKTVLVSQEGKLFLGGFCIERARCAAADLNALIYDGYAASEQYGVRQKIGTWTDVYAAAAVTYRCLTGLEPVSATARAMRDDMVIPAQVAQALPQNVIDALIDAFQVKPENRSVDISEYRAGLMGQSFKKKLYPLSYYSYNDVSYVNQDKKPYVAESTYFHPEIAAEEEKQPPAVIPAPDDESAGKKGMIAFFAVLALIAVAVGAYLLIDSGVFKKKPQTQAEPVATVGYFSVPDLVGKSEVSVKSDVGIREQFSLVYIKEYSRYAQEGYIFAQSVAAGQTLAGGSELVLYVSLGPRIIGVPDVIGLEYEAARAQLEQMGFVVTVNEKENFGYGTQGRVASVSPIPDTPLEEGETVYLSIWGELQTSPPTTEAPSVIVTQSAVPTFSSQTPSTTRRSGGLFDLFDLFGW